MNEEARELAEKWGCTPSNTCYWYCVEAAQREIDDDEDILCRSLELRVGESSGRAGSPERPAVVLNTVQACQVPKPWTLEGHFRSSRIFCWMLVGTRSARMTRR